MERATLHRVSCCGYRYSGRCVYTSARYLAVVGKQWGPCLDVDTALVGPEWGLILPVFLTSFQVI